jgi:hypothetical protein
MVASCLSKASYDFFALMSDMIGMHNYEPWPGGDDIVVDLTDDEHVIVFIYCIVIVTIL